MNFSISKIAFLTILCTFCNFYISIVAMLPCVKNIESVSFPVSKSGKKINAHSATIVEALDKSLVVAYYAGEAEGSSDTNIWLTRYDQAKGTWVEAVKIAEYQEVTKETRFAAACWNPVLVRLPEKGNDDEKRGNDLLLLFYKIGLKPAGWTGYYKISKDNGLTWGDPHQLPAGIVGPTKNKPYIHNDLLICPSSLECWHSWSVWFESIKIDSLLAGDRWARYRAGPLVLENQPFGVIQPTIFVSKKKKSKLYAICRTKNAADHKLYFTRSADCGKNWKPLQSLSLQSNDSGIDGIMLNDGRWLLVYSDCPEGERNKLDLAVSDDNGKTWKNAGCLVSDSVSHVSYPSIIQTSDGLVHVVYTAKNREAINHAVIDPNKITVVE